MTPNSSVMKSSIKYKAQGIPVKKKKEPAGIHLQQVLWQVPKITNHRWISTVQTEHTEQKPLVSIWPSQHKPDGRGNTVPNKTRGREPTGPSQHLYWKQEGTQCYRRVAELGPTVTNGYCATAIVRTMWWCIAIIPLQGGRSRKIRILRLISPSNTVNSSLNWLELSLKKTTTMKTNQPTNQNIERMVQL